MNHLAPTVGNAQLYSPAAAPAIFDGDSLKTDSTSTYSPATLSQPLTDGFARHLTYLRLSITDFCNFRCEYCLPDGYQGKPPQNELSVTEIATLVRGFAQVGTKKVRITGGEPSIRRDVVDIIKTIKNTEGIETCEIYYLVRVAIYLWCIGFFVYN